MDNSNKFLAVAKEVLSSEAAAILDLIPNLNKNFQQICACILQCQGKVVVTGMGKSGHIARKVAATMASTGTPAFFIHPAEASHGDLGMISKQDVILIFSNSGETDELLTILPPLKRAHIKIISITSNANSRIARYSDLHFLIGVTKEACPLNLAPTTSTTCALAIGDAIAISLLTAKSFNQQDFAKYHPNGKLGKRLLLTVADIMHSGDRIPIVTESTNLLEGIVEMSKQCFGLLLVSTEQNPTGIVGVLSDGDLRRIIDKGLNFHKTTLSTVINRDFKFISPDALALEALNIMQKYRIFSLPVIQQQKVVGIFNMHDLLQAGII